jgi:uncharacterized coiled-coil DUF342 family protein
MKEQLQQITQLHEQCHDSRGDLERSKAKCRSLEDELKRVTDQLEQFTLESSAIVSTPNNDTACVEEVLNTMTCASSCCFNPHQQLLCLPCLPQQQQSQQLHDSLLQKIERLEKERDEYKKKINDVQLHTG